MTVSELPTTDLDADQSLGGQVRRGTLWLGATSVMMRLSNVAIMAVVARLITPDEFGVFTLAMVAHAAIASFAELGIASAIARRDLDVRSIAPSAVTISVGVSAVLGGLMAVFAMPIATVLGSASAAPALRILSISIALTGVFVVPAAQLQRDFRQRDLFLSNLVGTIVGAALLIGLAMAGDGVLAFAWSRVGGQLVTGTMIVHALTSRHRPGWNRASVSLLLRFGLPLAAANLLSQAVANVDYVFVGRTLSLRDVGLYTLAFNISSWATSVIGSVISGVALPGFSAVRERQGDVRRALFTATRAVALVAFPIAAVTSGLASPLITTVYGGRWADAAPVVVILSVYGAAGAVGQLVANILIVWGRTVVLFTVQVVVLVVLVPALAVGITRMGLVGAGLAHVATVLLVTLPVYLYSLRKALGGGLGSMARGAWGPLVAALACGATAHLVALSLSGSPAWVQLVAGGTAAGVVYLLLTARQLGVLLPPAARARLDRAIGRRGAGQARDDVGSQ